MINVDLLSLALPASAGTALKRLAKKFDNLRLLAGASDNDFLLARLSPGQIIKLRAILSIAQSFDAVELQRGQQFSSAQQIFDHFHAKLRDAKKEHFFLVLLDTKHRIIREDVLSIGSLNLSVVHPREVFATAIRESAESILLVHNHPSGDPAPSSEDICVTQRLEQVGQLVGIRVLDHIIIGDGRFCSFLHEKRMSSSAYSMCAEEM